MSLLQFAIILAQDEPKGQEGFGGLGFLMPLLLMFAVFYFLMILPQRRQRQQHEAMLAALKKNDEVITSAGIIGVVASIKDTGDEVTLKIDDNVRMRVLRSSIIRINAAKEPAKDAPAENK